MGGEGEGGAVEVGIEWDEGEMMGGRGLWG
ncbi:hypothetical protein KS4_20850 [Poriferisphaera corsica]|uniref:Uncharacterized protein n=1 Tax=Poriferisphaera corsica TaxID=2528020 RepID=A0A517YUW8_9BACT|nr:hypothetical protein KS4_20850 [Poriferisphaera corsica]